MGKGSSRSARTGWLLGPLVALALACGSASRPPAPPAGEAYRLPWGAVPVEVWDREAEDELQAQLVRSIQRRLEEDRAQDPKARIPYQILSISGGGSRGAYGAGVLSGWAQAGTRPEFEVVTGISTGALMATHAFLGPDHDEDLRIYTRIDNDDIFRKRSRWEMLRGADSVLDTAPLREMLAGMLTGEIVDRVAAEHDRGRRLFIGTTDLDANAFVIWDMGAIAASDRPDRLERYRGVVLASASFPIAFPPVYIPVESEAGTWYQMHVDGGARETVFFYDFVDELREALDELGLSVSDVDSELFLLQNDALYRTSDYHPRKGGVLSVAGGTVSSLMRKATLGSLYRLWVQALGAGADFHIAFIPPDFELSPDSLDFDPEEMQRLFDLGYRTALEGSAWHTQEAPTSQEELVELIHPRASIDRLEARPWVEDGVD